jgi:DnaJ like chaperone protein
MAIWDNIRQVVAKLTTGALSSVVEAVRSVFEGDANTRQRVAFSIAMIALSAKMAKADGIVTFDEMQAFHQIFEVPAGEERNVARLFDLAKQDTAGYESYAAQIAGLCGSGEPDCASLEDIIDGLFHIAKADGALHEAELRFIESTATIFRISPEHYESILIRHGAGSEPDPYRVLGLARGAGLEEAKKAWRKLVQENHPDVLRGRGMPDEFIAIATERMKVINRAWTRLQSELQPA